MTRFLSILKGKIRVIPAQDKLEHLFCLLSSVLPVVKQIHADQCSELELERKIRGKMHMRLKLHMMGHIIYSYVWFIFNSGNRIDLPRMKLNADEQMCW